MPRVYSRRFPRRDRKVVHAQSARSAASISIAYSSGMTWTWRGSWATSGFITTSIACIARSMARRPHTAPAHPRPLLPRLIITLGGSIAAVCSRPPSPLVLGIRVPHAVCADSYALRMCGPKAGARSDRARGRRIVTIPESRVFHCGVQSRTSEAPSARCLGKLSTSAVHHLSDTNFCPIKRCHLSRLSAASDLIEVALLSATVSCTFRRLLFVSMLR
jgi:hypothetical protein